MSNLIHPKRWLWWAALWVLAIGLGLAYLMFYTASSPRTITAGIRLVAVLAFVGSGICVISATAHWWLKR